MLCLLRRCGRDPKCVRAGVVLSDGPDAKTVQNIDGEGHCVYYSGSIYTSAGATDDRRVYELAGGGFLAPEGTAGLDCE